MTKHGSMAAITSNNTVVQWDSVGVITPEDTQNTIIFLDYESPYHGTRYEILFMKTKFLNKSV